jgi:hypothetical protein
MNSERPVPGSGSSASTLPIVLGVVCLGLFLLCGGAGAGWFLMWRRATLSRAAEEHARAAAMMRERVAAAKAAPAREVELRLRPGDGGAVVILMDDHELGTVYDMDKAVKPLSENVRVYGEVATAARKAVGEQRATATIWPGPGGSAEHAAGLERALKERGFDEVRVER